MEREPPKPLTYQLYPPLPLLWWLSGIVWWSNLLEHQLEQGRWRHVIVGKDEQDRDGTP